MKETPKVLHLTLKKKWFDMIASGEKKEEYRDCVYFWDCRLLEPDCRLRHFDVVTFRNGYQKDAPTMTLKCEGIEIRSGRPEWGAVPYQVYYVIKLGERLS